MNLRRLGSTPRKARADALALLLLLAVPFAAVLTGTRGPITIRLNLGPGDGPYISGFQPGYEIDERVATHWSTCDAAVDLPLQLQGGPALLASRAARTLAEGARVEVALAGRAVDVFSPARVFQERSVNLGALAPTPLRISFRVYGPCPRSLGVKLDYVAVEMGEASRVGLRGEARMRPLLLVALVFLLLRLSGSAVLISILATAPWSLGLAFGLWWDPWLVHRLLTGLPETLALLSGFGLVVALWRWRLQGEGSVDLRWVTALTVTTFLLRAGALNHPDFYHPDFKIHAGLVEVVRKAGFDLLRDPSKHLWSPREDPSRSPSSGTSRAASGLWAVRTVGGAQGMPYSLAFHALVAPLGLRYDALLTLLKLVGALLSVVPIPIVWALARYLGVSPLGAVLLALVPTPMSELTIGALPALLGHAFDMGLLLWLAVHLERMHSPKVWVTGALLVSACQLAYVFSLPTTVLVLSGLAVLGPFTSGTLDRRWSAAVAGMGLVGTFIAFAIYYRGFWDGMAAISTSLIHPDPLAPAVPRFRFSYGFVHSFWGWSYAAAGLAGLGLLVRRAPSRALFGAWAGAYLVLITLRLVASDALRFGHENLFAAPLLVLGAGELTLALANRGRAGRLLAGGVLLVLAVSGVWAQGSALTEQLGRAR